MVIECNVVQFQFYFPKKVKTCRLTYTARYFYIFVSTLVFCMIHIKWTVLLVVICLSVVCCVLHKMTTMEISLWLDCVFLLSDFYMNVLTAAQCFLCYSIISYSVSIPCFNMNGSEWGLKTLFEIYYCIHMVTF